ncbi:MAG: ribosomal protein S18-alanine N-acetyltransferase [Gammaproteobacteria bacterium]|nr:ribosomal protein S18-alanine N-acetyltransferase [Gammaproteobacteria bacterium]
MTLNFSGNSQGYKKKCKLGEVIIRPVGLQDIPMVYKVETKSYTHPWSEKLLFDCVIVGYNCWLVEFQTQVIGHAVFRLALGEAHLFNIAVDPAFQNQGVGKVFLSFLLDQMRFKKAQKVIMEVRVTNTVARDLYKNFGFKELSIRKGYYPAENGGKEDGINLELVF